MLTMDAVSGTGGSAVLLAAQDNLNESEAGHPRSRVLQRSLSSPRDGLIEMTYQSTTRGLVSLRNDIQGGKGQGAGVMLKVHDAN